CRTPADRRRAASARAPTPWCPSGRGIEELDEPLVLRQLDRERRRALGLLLLGGHRAKLERVRRRAIERLVYLRQQLVAVGVRQRAPAERRRQHHDPRKRARHRHPSRERITAPAETAACAS